MISYTVREILITCLFPCLVPGLGSGGGAELGGGGTWRPWKFIIFSCPGVK